jgi:hypothetical protein
VNQPRRPLAQLLLDSVQGARSPAPPTFDQRLTRVPVDQVVAAGSLHRVTPAIAHHVGRIDGGVPEDWRVALGHFRHAQLARHLRTRTDLGLIQSALDAAGIVWVVVKGPVCADLNWPRPDLREYYDLDVVIDRHRLGDALRVLEAAGCSYVDRNWPMIRQTMRAELAMTAPMGTPLDVHWHIAVPRDLRHHFSIDVAAMLSRRKRAPLGNDLRTWVLDPPDSVFHLAFHAAQAGAGRLVWPADVWFAAQQLSDTGWVQLSAWATACRAQLPVALVLGRMVRLFGKPPGFGDRMLEPANGWWGRLISGRDRSVPQPGLPPDPRLGGTLYSSARRNQPASVLNTAISRWRLQRLQRPGRSEDTQSQMLGRKVPDAAARLSYFHLVQNATMP